MGVKMSGSRIVLECLKREGVDTVFGLPGGAVLPIYDALYDTEGLRHILVRQEAAAGHAAEGYARTTGKVGVCLVTSGPAATNVVTALQDAYMDSIPIVAFTGQVPTHLIGNDAFQEADNVGITRPCTKHNFLVKDGKDLAPIIREAFHIAATGRPGPVHVDLPKDILVKEWAFSYPEQVHLRSYNPTYEGHPGQIKKAARALVRAKRPVLYVGGGAISADASPELMELVELTQIPITQTLMGLGAFPMAHPLSLDMLGMHGTYYANMAVHHSDVLVAVGARFDDRVTGRVDAFAPKAEIVHIDIDPSSISKRVKVDVPIVGNIPDVLEDVLKLLKSARPKDISAWWKQIDEWRAKDCLRYDRKSPIIKPQHVVEKLYEVTRGEAFVTSDVGQHQMWAAQFYRFDKPRRWINSGGLGTMGVGLPYAMGVKLAFPDAEVACITGEASIQMCIQELSTCKQYRLPLKIVNLNNKYMGMVRQWQEFFHGNRYAESYMDALPDFVKLAESYGHVGMKIEKPEDVEPAMKEAFSRKDELVFMDFVTDQTENVFPMVPGGKGLSEMILV